MQGFKGYCEAGGSNSVILNRITAHLTFDTLFVPTIIFDHRQGLFEIKIFCYPGHGNNVYSMSGKRFRCNV